jgi:hypothetical protein
MESIVFKRYYIKGYKKLAILILGLIFWVPIYAQTQNDLIGDWNVTTVILPDNLNPAMKTKFKDLVIHFENASFHFKSNKDFILDIPDKNFQINSAKWDYDEIQKIVTIKGKDSMGHFGILMKFGIRIEESGVYFLLEETPFTLQVKKVVLESI